MDNIYQMYDTRLSPKETIAYMLAKKNSDFANDSGYDYDYKGYWKQYGGFDTNAANGHLTDEFKKPNHPTFSIESNYYNGQPYAVDWNSPAYKFLSERGYLWYWIIAEIKKNYMIYF